MKLESLFEYCDRYLGVADHPDYANAHNGLQVQGRGEGELVCAAVDASEEVIEAAAAEGADVLLVHHGLFWGGLQPVRGPAYRKLSRLILDGIALYSVHLPLDSHPEVGNCALLAKALGVAPTERFGGYEGEPIGWSGPFDGSRQELAERMQEVLGGPVHVIPGGSDTIGRIGVVTGGGASFIEDAAEAGLDAFVTGEGAHHTHALAMELGVNVLYGGHYATETFGVRALARHLAERFDLRWTFLDFPSGL